MLTFKKVPPEQRRAVVMDIEKGQAEEIEPYAWEAGTCIGNWFYVKEINYKPASQVIAMLVDVVSKNGNLLLSIPQRGDGTIDDRERQILEELAAWMDVNGEAIFGTRPWKIYGEGPTKIETGPFKEQAAEYTSQDVRFTTKGDVLYAMVMAWPADGRLTIRSLAKDGKLYPDEISDVNLLAGPGTAQQKLKFARTADGLAVELPPAKPCEHVFTLKITKGQN